MRVVLLFTICNGVFSVANKNQPTYAIVVDAGSTGTRAFVFQEYLTDENERVIQSYSCGKERMGLSSFVNNPRAASELFTGSLLRTAADIIPSKYHSSTSVYVRGTAGMRLLESKDQEFLWDALVHQLKQSPEVPFHIDRKNFGTISGHEEAFYAVMASNYIAGSIDGNLRLVSGATLIGALDMGGSSNQLIIYNGSNPKAKIETTHFWSHSWLRYGAEMIRERILQHIYESHARLTANTRDTTTDKADSRNATDVLDAVMLENPCAFADYLDAYVDQYIFLGTGNATECVKLIERIVWADGVEIGSTEGELFTDGVAVEGSAELNPELSSSQFYPSEGIGCVRGPCAIEEVLHPSVQGHRFYAMSVYFYALDCVRQLGPEPLHHWPNPSISELRVATDKFCALPWEEVHDKHSAGVGHQWTYNSQLPYRCMEALYIVTLLEKGFGFDPDSRSITLALEVEGKEVEWTLGYVLAEVDFTASISDSDDGQPLAEERLSDIEKSRQLLLLYADIANRMIILLERAAKDALEGLSALRMHYQSIAKKLLGN
eukprot:CAMPEP_0170365636 /NCGR_PEP_ID=MMETSP0117_2-20130122/6004_1 /TAXON_ID=400756 /ORGANISM="Durinskia baltica, Strain CSIRO CS-38" /LENGTH=547 /DNA_ID=CAMNT_0010620199 /DNA_START=104 /DNA_END=1747 /DNA_ORIENTATION=+